MKFNIVLTEDDIKNLFILLDRVELKGHSERRALNSIENAIIMAQEIKNTETNNPVE